MRRQRVEHEKYLPVQKTCIAIEEAAKADNNILLEVEMEDHNEYFAEAYMTWYVDRESLYKNHLRFIILSGSFFRRRLNELHHRQIR
jgi:hypothetical protein